MSRSHKKHPWCKGGGRFGRRYMKKRANKLARIEFKALDDDMPMIKNKGYRLAIEPWDLYDWRSRWSRKWAEQHNKLDVWYKYHYRK